MDRDAISESVDAHAVNPDVSRRVPLLRLGLVLSMFSAAVFVTMRLPQLPLHFQVDGQLAEYLAWSRAPASIGNSLNQDLNPRLFSVYYPTLAFFAKHFSRLDVLRGAFAIELVLLAAAVFTLGVTLTRNALTGALASIAIIWGNGMAVSLGGSGGVGLVCNPEFPATAAICFALALSWRRRHVWAGLIAGLAFNVHGSIALFGAAMVCTAALFDGWQRSTLRRTWLAWLVCLIAAAPTVLWVLATPTPAGASGITLWMQFPKWIYPKHMLVSATQARVWLQLAVYLIPGVLGWQAMRGMYRQRLGAVQGWLYAAAVLLIVGYVFVEWWPVRFVAQLTLWRGTRFIQLVGLAVGIRWLVDVAHGGGLRAVLAGVTLTGFLVPFTTALITPAHVALALLLLIASIGEKGAFRWAVIVMLGITIGLIGFEYSGLMRLSSYVAPRWLALVVGMTVVVVWASRRLETWRPACVIVCAVGACVFVNRVGAVPTFRSWQRHRAEAMLDLAPAIERACPPGETVIAPPDLRNPGAWANRGSFLCRQQLTAYAYGPWLVDRLIERMDWYLGADVRDMPADDSMMQRLLDGYRARDTAAFEVLREQYGVGVAVVELRQHLNFRVVAVNDSFRVYDLCAPLGEVQARGDGLD